MTDREVKTLYEWMSEHGFKNVNKQGEAIIKQALVKQIPKKPKRKGYRDGCPVCSVIFEENNFGIHYCWNCGTKLDWSDSNEY